MILELMTKKGNSKINFRLETRISLKEI